MLFTVLCPNSLMLPFVSLEERNINAAGKIFLYILELFITCMLPVYILISTLIVYLFFLSCREEARSAQGVGKTSRCVDYGDTGQECLPHLCLSEPYKTKTAAAAKMTGYREHRYCCVRFFSCKTTAPVLPSCIKGAKNIVFPWVSPWLRLCSALPRAGGAALSLIRRAVQSSPQRDGACRGLYPNACSKCLGIVRISVQLGKQVRRECRHE